MGSKDSEIKDKEMEKQGRPDMEDGKRKDEKRKLGKS